MSTVLPNLYCVVFPDPQISRRLEKLICDWDANAQVQIIPGLEELYSHLPTVAEKAVVLISLVWNEHNIADILPSLSHSYPHLAFLIVSDLPASAYFPIPQVRSQDDNEVLTAVASLSEDLRGTELGAYQLRQFAGQNYLGRVYHAFQPAINREVQLTVLPPHADDAQRSAFSATASAWAGNVFPQIYSIYEENSADGRQYVAQEPVTDTSLLQLGLQKVSLNSRLIAGIVATVAKTLAHLHEKNIPYQPINAGHITLSPEGTIRLVNTALPAGSPMPEAREELRRLAQIIRPFIAPLPPIDARLRQALDNMDRGQADFASVIGVAEQTNLALAPVKKVAERKSAVKAKQEVTKARKNSWLVMSIAAGAVGALVLVILLNVVLMLIDVPGRDLSQQIEIPAGTVQFYDTQKKLQTAEIGKFYLDQYEVTIGEYEKFLKAMEEEKLKDPKAHEKYLPADSKYSKEDFEPLDWKNIQRALRKTFPQRTYGSNRITRDTPVFNIDYIDAYAYAKWAGKRLPRELEWQRAASGNDNFAYPWGKDYKTDYQPDNTICNAYPDLIRAKKNRWPGPQIVDSFPADKSPFGIIGMAGNVSEWVDFSPELGPLKDVNQERRSTKGANFTSPQLVPNSYNRTQLLLEGSKTTSLGFRCASDQPMKKETAKKK
ncbi:MAG: SUMF1/EgtB/PvdO family nonheme iron enzyme [Verrucomicrobiales bacterium]|jgi:formylglycine-generating enzyme required for sulfatase activity|nr:SUMF1/EgtB/PvdO family nonheme iron enzyme [Verrucomicrobiales bacterium]